MAHFGAAHIEQAISSIAYNIDRFVVADHQVSLSKQPLQRPAATNKAKESNCLLTYTRVHYVGLALISLHVAPLPVSSGHTSAMRRYNLHVHVDGVTTSWLWWIVNEYGHACPPQWGRKGRRPHSQPTTSTPPACSPPYRY